MFQLILGKQIPSRKSFGDRLDALGLSVILREARGNPGMAGFGCFFIDSDFLWGLLCAILGSNQLFLQNQWLPSWQSKKRLVKAGEIFGWKLILNFWLQAYSDPFLVHWSIYTRCLNCIKLTQSFSFRITHIYREVNACADKLVVLGSQGLGYTWWHSPPSFVLRSSLGTGKGFLSTDFCKRLSLSMV